MSNAVLEVLQILMYLAIGLMSVTFPIYAICVTYLRQEKWETKKERKKRIEKLRTRISELTTELEGKEQDRERVTQLREQIEKYEIELKGTELGVQYLTAKGAVGIPVQYLAIALTAAGVGIYSFYEDLWLVVPICGVISIVFSTFTVFSLYKTISAVEYAALRPARTVEFTVGFIPSWETIKQIKLGEHSKLRIFAKAIEANIEDFMVYMEIPSEIKTGIESVSENVVISKYLNYTMARCYTKFLPKNRGAGITFDVVPKKTGEYTIPVKVYGKGIYEYKKELTLNVVK